MINLLRLFALMLLSATFICTTSFAACTGSSPTWTSTPDYTSINTCVTNASAGDTINVTAATADWGANTLSVTKAIKLIGAGGSNTVITGKGPLLSINTGAPGGTFAFRLSGFKFTNPTTGSIGSLWNGGKGWRIDHNIFDHPQPSALFSFNNNNGSAWSLFGLIDNNTFNNANIGIVGDSDSAEDSWQAAAQWGTDNAVFIEDNTFTMNTTCGVGNVNSIDHNNGARSVIRHNIFYDAYVEIHSACQTSVRGNRSTEIYDNIFRRTCDDYAGYVNLRGGSAVITDNLVTGRWYSGGGNSGKVAIDNRRSFWDVGCCAVADCTGAGVPNYCCTGVGTGTCAGWGFGDCDGTKAVDGNASNPAHGGTVDGWPCLDQPGRGTGVIGSQASDPIYIWNNTTGKNCLGGANKFATCTVDGDCPSSTCSTETTQPNVVYLRVNTGNSPYQIVSGRDYYENTAKSGYTKYAYPHPLTAPYPPRNLRIIQ